MPDLTAGTQVEVVRGAVVVSDPDPGYLALLVCARNVLGGAAEVLAEPGCTLREAKFAANELSRSLRDMLDLVDPKD